MKIMKDLSDAIIVIKDNYPDCYIRKIKMSNGNYGLYNFSLDWRDADNDSLKGTINKYTQEIKIGAKVLKY